MIKFNLHEIKIERSWISSFANPTKINKKNVTNIFENGKLQLNPNY